MDKSEITYLLFSKEYNKDSLISYAKDIISDSEKEVWEREIFEFIINWFGESETINVKTSGSTGKPKDISLAKNHMLNSAKATINFLGLKPKSKILLCLPANYIAGKMMIVRWLINGLDLYYIKPGIAPDLTTQQKFSLIALIPSMLSKYLKANNKNILENYENIILGGSAIDYNTEQGLLNLNNKIWHTYGMTETITHIALRRLNGRNKSLWFKCLDGVGINKSNDDTLIIDYPLIGVNKLHTNDLVHINMDGSFRILGRIDNVIISGGIKISAEEYEASLSDIIEDQYFVLGQKDDTLGERLILFIETNREINKVEILKKIRQLIPRNKIPKEVVIVDKFDRTKSGKIIRRIYS